MPAHRFPVGQSVRLKSRQGLSPMAADTYRVIALLPARDNSPQYRMRNDEVAQERVSLERDIEAFDLPAETAAE
ncbi:hypothetical protein [Rhizobium sp. HT1-10]|uniref:hypothetical protein n=1 Tax=Rhizobium sp. HT1-10 TaxID=3111638 RepID=UPI003C17907B